MPNTTDRPNSSAAGQPALPPDARPDIDRVLLAFERFQHRLMSVHAVELAAVELTMAQAKLLYVVVASGSLSLTEIAGRLGISLSTASGAVDRLVELGLLSREAVPTNRRQVTVAVTPLGIETIEQFHELGARQMRAFLAAVPAADLDLVERAIQILANAVPDPLEGQPTTRRES